MSINTTAIVRFNTQPPEGGWMASRLRPFEQNSFNTQPPEGGWVAGVQGLVRQHVSTHSRLKAAGKPHYSNTDELTFQHTAA